MKVSDNISEAIASIVPDMIEWRHDLHAHPELGFDEHRTAALVSAKLRSWGIDVIDGIAGTGVVGTLRAGSGTDAIAIRADMDALPIEEATALAYTSLHSGVMHACGHDGHTTMLLGAARYLAETQRFNGTVHFVFQPAEEGRGGAKRMISEGLFERFPVKAIYGAHNDPTLPVGTCALKSGPVTAATTRFWIDIVGRGAHASRPHEALDPILIGSHIVVALQSIVARRLNPIECGVVSVTQFHGGSTGNVIPGAATLNGTIRAHSRDVFDQLKSWVSDIADATARTHGGSASVRFEGSAPPTINAAHTTAGLAIAASSLLGRTSVKTDRPTEMIGEDFAEMAAAVDASFIFIGQAAGGKGGTPLHHPEYDFNDDILPIGAALWASLVEQELT